MVAKVKWFSSYKHLKVKKPRFEIIALIASREKIMGPGRPRRKSFLLYYHNLCHRFMTFQFNIDVLMFSYIKIANFRDEFN